MALPSTRRLNAHRAVLGDRRRSEDRHSSAGSGARSAAETGGWAGSVRIRSHDGPAGYPEGLRCCRSSVRSLDQARSPMSQMLGETPRRSEAGHRQLPGDDLAAAAGTGGKFTVPQVLRARPGQAGDLGTTPMAHWEWVRWIKATSSSTRSRRRARVQRSASLLLRCPPAPIGLARQAAIA